MPGTGKSLVLFGLPQFAEVVVAVGRRVQHLELPASRLRILAGSQHIAAEAGLSLARAGRRTEAVIVLEVSRGVLLTRLVGGLDPQIRAGLVAAGRLDLLRSHLNALRGRAARVCRPRAADAP